MPQTLYDKLWESHLIWGDDEMGWLYIDLHLVHEATSAVAFAGLRQNGRRVRRSDLTYCVTDHIVPTVNRHLPITDPLTSRLIEAMQHNAADFGLPLFGPEHPDNGIVHVVGPELGLTTPGKTVVCGDSHTATHGAFGCLGFGIGTSEIEHVLATQTLPQKKAKRMQVDVSGVLPLGVTAKDAVMCLIREVGAGGGTGYAIEFTGSAVRAMSMEERMTLCNMAIEAGARTGMVAPDETTFAYLSKTPYAPAGKEWDQAVAEWSRYRTDPGAVYDRVVNLEASSLRPLITWGTSPEMVVGVDERVPDPEDFTDCKRREAAQQALRYMALSAGTHMQEIGVNKVFIGSCTNSRIEDLRAAAAMVHGEKVAPGVEALVVPGSYRVKKQAEAEGLDEIFRQAGFSWRDPGCSMCVAFNGDVVLPGERAASTSNRNFDGRQGKNARTHLVSPAMAAAAAIAGHFVDIRTWKV